MDYLTIFSDAVVDSLVQKHTFSLVHNQKEEVIQHLSEAEQIGHAAQSSIDGNDFSVKKVAEELLVLAHGTPYQRNLFLKKDYVDEDGRDHFTMHYLQ